MNPEGEKIESTEIPFVALMALRNSMPIELLPDFERVMNEVTEDEFTGANQSRNNLLRYLINKHYEDEGRLASQAILADEVKRAVSERPFRGPKPQRIALLVGLILICAFLVITGIMTQLTLHRQKITEYRKSTQKIIEKLASEGADHSHDGEDHSHHEAKATQR